MDIAKVRVVKANTAAEVVLHRTEEAIKASLDSFGEIRGRVGKNLRTCTFTGRTGRGYEHKGKVMIPMSSRSPSKPYQLVMKKDVRPQAPYLKEKELLFLMIAVDKKEGRKDVLQPKEKAIRSLFTIVLAHTNKACYCPKGRAATGGHQGSSPER
jgi:hypothetical protein